MTPDHYIVVYLLIGMAVIGLIETVEPSLADLKELAGSGATMFVVIMLSLLWPFTLCLFIRHLWMNRS